MKSNSNSRTNIDPFSQLLVSRIDVIAKKKIYDSSNGSSVQSFVIRRNFARSVNKSRRCFFVVEKNRMFYEWIWYFFDKIQITSNLAKRNVLSPHETVSFFFFLLFLFFLKKKEKEQEGKGKGTKRTTKKQTVHIVRVDFIVFFRRWESPQGEFNCYSMRCSLKTTSCCM